jgi:NADPH:quinone reductase-like Zn-dependent oxidoreductase
VNSSRPLTLRGKYAREWGNDLPLIPGYEIAGIIEKAGAKFTSLKPGDAVYGYPTFRRRLGRIRHGQGMGGRAETEITQLCEAAAVPMGALTAWQALVDVAQLPEGQTILIHGGSGGVGSFAIQIAKVRGARVIATASTANQDLLKQLGADVAIDYTKQNSKRSRKTSIACWIRSAKTPLPDLTCSEERRHHFGARGPARSGGTQETRDSGG